MAQRVRPSSQSGFTLIEVLVAMLILLVGVLGVVTMVDGANTGDTTVDLVIHCPA